MRFWPRSAGTSLERWRRQSTDGSAPRSAGPRPVTSRRVVASLGNGGRRRRCGASGSATNRFHRALFGEALPAAAATRRDACVHLRCRRRAVRERSRRRLVFLGPGRSTAVRRERRRSAARRLAERRPPGSRHARRRLAGGRISVAQCGGGGLPIRPVCQRVWHRWNRRRAVGCGLDQRAPVRRSVAGRWLGLGGSSVLVGARRQWSAAGRGGAP